MRKVLFFAVLLAGTVAVAQPHRCAFDQIMEADMDRSAAYRKLVNEYRMRQTERSAARTEAIDDSTIYRIPVVVHVVWSSTASNISEARIRNQIEVLNNDFRKKEGTNGFSTHPLAADSRIEFYLADIDPDSNVTTGIVRVRGSQPSYSVFNVGDVAKLKQSSYWPADRYLNIWVCSLEGKYLGFGVFPFSTEVEGLEDPATNIKYDGVVIDYNFFGTTNSGLYGYGRTTTHEVGHFLGLFHPWGKTFGCGEDYCQDTPPVQEEGNQRSFFSCTAIDSCSGVGPSQIENYMDYSPDLCMNMFSECQVRRMRTILQTNNRRKALYLPKQLRKVYYYNLELNGMAENFVISDTLIEAELKIYDISGRLIDEQKIALGNSFTYSAPLAEGLYIYSFIGGGAQRKRKFGVLRQN